ncbi:NAD(+)-dependent DNA ligase LigA [[Mycoplasma] cavipharyngis]|uniref:NAD-dependent DNA ligase LigA n=1 Tax=[Mycoplasma] cavipharyngis TaxID=92757 RepID=UPI00370453F9
MDQKIIEKIKKLRNKINLWNDAYYQGQPLVDDEFYDAQLRQLIAWEKQYPELIANDSPSQQVGTVIKNVFLKKNHQVPMLSLDNAFDLSELNTFYQNCFKVTHDLKGFMIEPKIDGSSISLIYRDNYLFDAVSRGDGFVGESILNNIKTIKNIPHYVANGPGNFEVRGEIFLSKPNYEKYKQTVLDQQDQTSNKVITVGNSRNIVAGTLRLLNPQLVATRPLEAVFYQIVNAIDLKITTQKEVHQQLVKWQFSIPDQNYVTHENDFNDLVKFIDQFLLVKNQLLIPCDGLVIKVNNLLVHDLIGYTAKFPKWAIAYKFPSTIKKTRLLKIEPTTGRTGKITYVGTLAPVDIDGTIIRSVTLHNAQYIIQKDLRINDLVSVYKSGEIIPQVIEVDLNCRDDHSVAWTPVLNCPSCDDSLIVLANQVDQFCPNENCMAKISGQIIHWCSRNAMNIVGLSEKTIAKFQKLKIVHDISDLYHLDQHKDLILNAKINIKDKLFDKLIDAINQSKNNDFHQVLFGLGIEHVGLQVAKLLVDKYHNLTNLAQANFTDLAAINDIGPKTAQTIINWFNKPSNQLLLSKLAAVGINFQQKPKVVVHNNNNNNNSYLQNQNVVITGTFWISRDQLGAILNQQFNCQIQNQVTKKTNYLIVGTNPGSKLIKAEKWNIKTIDQTEIRKLINNDNN